MRAHAWLVVDPGKVTGLVWLISDPGLEAGPAWLPDGMQPAPRPRALPGGELPHWDFLEYVEEAVLSGGDESRAVWYDEYGEDGRALELDGVVCESFRVTQRTAKEVGSDRLYSVEQIGVLRLLCRKAGLEYVEQTPSDAKSFGSDEKLRRLGWYSGARGERGHRRDAARHALLFGVRRGIIGPEEVA